jgi:DNA polymerase sigma
MCTSSQSSFVDIHVSFDSASENCWEYIFDVKLQQIELKSYRFILDNIETLWQSLCSDPHKLLRCVQIKSYY